MTGPWIADASEEEEHPTVPIGINEMTIPRVALVRAVVTLVGILIMGGVIGFSFVSFLNSMDESLAAGNDDVLMEDGRWVWEVHFLFDTCTPRNDAWEMPEVLSDQDDEYLYPGELQCEWLHQGQGDRAVVVIYNRGPSSVDLMLTSDHESIVFGESDETSLLVPGLDGESFHFAMLDLKEDIDETSFTINASHVTVMDAVVGMDINLMRGSTTEPVHSDPGDRLQVNYKVWDADTEVLLDEGDLPATAGPDAMCETGAPWICYIDGFPWSLLGLDIGQDRGVLGPGTSHITLLPPPIAYGGSEGHELENSWLRFEVELTLLAAI